MPLHFNHSVIATKKRSHHKPIEVMNFTTPELSLASCLCAPIITWLWPRCFVGVVYSLLLVVQNTEQWAAELGPQWQSNCAPIGGFQKASDGKAKSETGCSVQWLQSPVRKGQAKPTVGSDHHRLCLGPVQTSQDTVCRIKVVHRVFADLTGHGARWSQPLVCGGHASISPQRRTG